MVKKGERSLIRGNIQLDDTGFSIDSYIGGMADAELIDHQLHIIFEGLDYYELSDVYVNQTKMATPPVIEVKDSYLHFYNVSYLDDINAVQEKIGGELSFEETDFGSYMNSTNYNYSAVFSNHTIYQYTLDVPTKELLYFIQTTELPLYTDESSYYIHNEAVDELIKFQAFELASDTVRVSILPADNNFKYAVMDDYTYQINE